MHCCLLQPKIFFRVSKDPDECLLLIMITISNYLFFNLERLPGSIAQSRQVPTSHSLQFHFVFDSFPRLEHGTYFTIKYLYHFDELVYVKILLHYKVYFISILRDRPVFFVGWGGGDEKFVPISIVFFCDCVCANHFFSAQPSKFIFSFAAIWPQTAQVWSPVKNFSC